MLNMPPKYIYTRRAVASLLFLLLPSTSFAAATFSGDTSGISVQSLPANTVSLRVSGPEGFYVETESSSFSTENGLADGQYSYEIYAEVESVAVTADAGNSGRGENAGRSGVTTDVVESGNFRLFNGAVVNNNEEE